MKNKIEKLLNSPVYEDILLGIELSFEFTIGDFESLYNLHTRYTPKFGDWFIAFGRNKVVYHFSSGGEIYTYYIENKETWDKTYAVTDFGKDWTVLGYQEN